MNQEEDSNQIPRSKTYTNSLGKTSKFTIIFLI